MSKNKQWKAIGLYDDATAKVGQTIKVKSVDENSLPTEWEAMDAPVVEGAVLKSELFETISSGTIEWDGNTESLEVFDGTFFKISKISDETAVAIADAGLTVTAIDQDGNLVVLNNQLIYGGDLSVWAHPNNSGWGVIVAGSENYSVVGAPSTGIWTNISNGSYFSSITFEGIVLDEKDVIKKDLILDGAIKAEAWIFELEDGTSIMKQVAVVV